MAPQGAEDGQLGAAHHITSLGGHHPTPERALAGARSPNILAPVREVLGEWDEEQYAGARSRALEPQLPGVPIPEPPPSAGDDLSGGLDGLAPRRLGATSRRKRRGWN